MSDGESATLRATCVYDKLTPTEVYKLSLPCMILGVRLAVCTVVQRLSDYPGDDSCNASELTPSSFRPYPLLSSPRCEVSDLY